MWKHPAGVIAAFIMFAAVSAPVSAQLQLYGFLPPLTQKDIALIREKTDDFGNRPAGTTVEWSNPDSGNSGTVTLLQTFTNKDRPCEQILYVFNIKGETSPRNYTLVWCEVSKGEWRIM
jgi:hypothetical protein